MSEGYKKGLPLTDPADGGRENTGLHYHQQSSGSDDEVDSKD